MSAATPAEAPARTAQPRRWPRRLLIGAAALLLLAALITWALPPAFSALLRHELPPRLSELLGRPVSVGDVRVQPWQLALGIDQLRIGAAPGQGDAPQLELGRIDVVLSAASLRHRAPVVASLTVQSPRLRLARTAPGRLDIDDVLQRLAQAKLADSGAKDEPARFALYNLQLDDGQITLEDRPVGRSHRIEALSLGLPFLSNLPADVAVHTEPRLRLKLDGTAIDSGGKALPFAQTRQATLSFSFANLDLAPWLVYQPASLPLRAASGRLSSQLSLDFAQPAQGSPRVTLRGDLKLDDVALQARDGAPLAGWKQLALELRDVQPLARRVALGTLRLDGPQLTLTRGANGRLNWQGLGGDEKPAAEGQAATAQSPWQVTLEALQLQAGTVDWRDASLPGAARQSPHHWQLADLGVKAGPLQWPAAALAPLSLSATLQHAGQARGHLAVEGRASDREASATLTASDVSLAAAAPYLAPVLVPQLHGRLSAQAQLDWAASAEAPRLAIHLPELRLDDLALRQAPAASAPRGTATRTVAGWRLLRVQDLRLDLLTHRATLGRVKLSAPQLEVERAADGQLNLAQWLRAPATSASRASTSDKNKAPNASSTDWQLRLDELALDGGRLRFIDLGVHDAPGEPLRAELAQLRLRLRQLNWPVAARQAPMPLQIDARVGVPAAAVVAAPTGELHWAGRVGLAPLQADGRLQARNLPLHLLERYASEAMGPLTLLHADGSLDGRLALRQLAEGWQLSTQADVRIDELQLHTRPEAGGRLDAGSELLSWQSLALGGLQFTLAPGARPRLVLREATLSDFYSRLVITEEGRFNLRDVAARPAAGAASAPGAVPPPPEPVATAAAPPSAAASAPAEELPIDLEIGATRLVNGRVDFTDNFVRPHYSARLSALNGQLGALRSGTREMATLTLAGRAADTASLEISGQLNPTAQPLALDIRARASDLELAPLSPYAGKYAGYAIERGKLSMDVSYKISPDGKLDAKNQVILNQLTFGERVESPDATQLPVLLAVALLKDRHGVIDINLPVSGSLDDPQFSVGGLIFKVIVNLLGKALTAPFSLLTGGGGPDISQVDFVPGVAEVAPSGQPVLDKVAQALLDRPALQMTVAGAADPLSEREAWQAAALEARLQAERRRAQLRAAPAAASIAATAPGPAASAPATPITGDERTRLLRELYRNTALPDRPRNLVGLLRELPPAEMEARLKAGLVVSTDVMRELALQRGLAVRDALVARGLPAERLFLAAPLLRASGEDDASWVPRVKLTLALP